ncbi:hypothetical protein HNO88_002036 [Novosphingobium chloroacetimidivorans]|uniref:Uncharacterized protein n=1 Tax=Novosphingobium chloroacetimidivorans TaxID=1428314 RepID=A0A7W7NX14_9SPHN|nr:hypothetical protein [Novosphingobium chloroacetimidivorans]MBB4858710.1 hypothetical protein [Novosphingobium chloroacetimidivorans]
MFGALLLMLAAAPSAAAPAKPPSSMPMVAGTAETLRRIPAPEARQGVAVGPNDVWAIANYRIARYDKRTGEKRAAWAGDPQRFPHINSCALIARELVCAASNFPQVPQTSSVEIFDPQSLVHKRSVSLGMQIGSLTWVDRRDGAWWAMFANYDGKGGEPPRDHRHTQLVRFDDAWRRTESWALPRQILERIAPMSISGGGWGTDGRLYLSGHDLPELYAVTLPKGGATLDYRGTYAMAAEGQAIDWDESAPWHLWGIARKGGEMIEMRLAN